MDENKQKDDAVKTPEPGEDLLPTLLPESGIPQKPRHKPLIGWVIAIIIIPIVAAATQLPQTLSSMAAARKCTKITNVGINPGEIKTTVKSAPTQLSTMAYDESGNQVAGKVVFNWGISSTNSIGTLRSNDDLATFYPKNTGRGDLYVQAINSCTKKGVIGSVLVNVY